MSESPSRSVTITITRSNCSNCSFEKLIQFIAVSDENDWRYVIHRPLCFHHTDQLSQTRVCWQWLLLGHDPNALSTRITALPRLDETAWVPASLTACSNGRSTVNVDPLPSSLSTLIFPLNDPTNSRVIDSPKPAPTFRPSESVLLTPNGSNMLATRLLSMPAPVSLISKRQRLELLTGAQTSIETIPDCVNFTAFDTKLAMICCNRAGSPNT